MLFAVVNSQRKPVKSGQPNEGRVEPFLTRAPGVAAGFTWRLVRAYGRHAGTPVPAFVARLAGFRVEPLA